MVKMYRELLGLCVDKVAVSVRTDVGHIERAS